MDPRSLTPFRRLMVLVPMKIRQSMDFALSYHFELGEHAASLFISGLTPEGSELNLRNLSSARISRLKAMGLVLDWRTDPGAVREVLIEREYDYPGYIPDSGTYVLDIGAQHGEYSILSASVRGASVSAFEPIHENCNIIRTNAQLNGVSDLDLHETAIGSEDAALQGRKFGSMFVRSGPGTPRRRVWMQAKSLDSLDLSRAIGSSSVLMKIDVEGFELQVLQGAITFIRKNSPRIIVEVDSATDQGVRKFLESCGYLVQFERRKILSKILFARAGSSNLEGEKVLSKKVGSQVAGAS